MADHKIDGNDGAGNVQAPERIWASNRTNGNCVVSFTSRSEEYSIEYICADRFSYQLAAANARADAARDAALVEAADIILADNYDDPDDAADAILDLRNKPAPEVTEISPHPYDDCAHFDDHAANRFVAVMKGKLAAKRLSGRGGWDRKDEVSNEYLSRLLREHVNKGDPVDVANLAMMIHQRGEKISDKPAPAVTVPITTVQDAARVLLGVFEDPYANAPHGFDWQSMYDEMTADHKESRDICGTHDWPSTLIVALRAIAGCEA